MDIVLKAGLSGALPRWKRTADNVPKKPTLLTFAESCHTMVGNVEIIEKEFVSLKNPTIIEGFPSVGLVGAIATEFLASKLGLAEIGFMKSRKLPPVTIVKDGIPKSPIRFYANENIVAIVSDTAVPSSLTYDIADSVVEWAVKHNAARIISLGGIARQEGAGVGTGKESDDDVFAVAASSDTLAKLSAKNYRTIKLGFLTGVFGILMLECLERNIEAFGFLADAHADRPDPKAAALVLDAATKYMGLSLDTKSLLDTSTKIDQRMGELLKQTKKTLDDTAYPSVYG